MSVSGMGLAERRKGARVAEQAVANAGAAVIFAFMGQPLAMSAALAACAWAHNGSNASPIATPQHFTKERIRLPSSRS